VPIFYVFLGLPGFPGASAPAHTLEKHSPLSAHSVPPPCNPPCGITGGVECGVTWGTHQPDSGGQVMCDITTARRVYLTSYISSSSSRATLCGKQGEPSCSGGHVRLHTFCLYLCVRNTHILTWRHKLGMHNGCEGRLTGRGNTAEYNLFRLPVPNFAHSMAKRLATAQQTQRILVRLEVETTNVHGSKLDGNCTECCLDTPVGPIWEVHHFPGNHAVLTKGGGGQ